MKGVAVLLLAVVFIGACEANWFTDTLKNLGQQFNNSTKELGKKLTVVSQALGDVAKQKAKSLGSQALQGEYL